MNKAKRDELRAMLALATGEEWFARGRFVSTMPDNSGMGAILPGNSIANAAESWDADFIAAARNNLGALLDQLDAADRVIEELRSDLEEAVGYVPEYFKSKWDCGASLKLADEYETSTRIR